ncbi:hypothetical protein GEMRC1_011802 [Eukaryota sp. GEM-RC1]
MLIDFNDYDNWSKYTPIVQLLVNTTKSRVTGFTPSQLIFGSATSPGSDPSKILVEINQSSTQPVITAEPTSSSLYSSGDLVLKAYSKTKKLHGKLKGPFLVLDTPTASSLTLQNIITGHQFKSSVHQCKKYLTDKPSSDEFHTAVAACDSEEMVVIKVLSQSDSSSAPVCSVVWFDGDTTEVPLDQIKNTKAYSEFIKSNPSYKPSTKKKRIVQGSTSRASPPAKRTRSSRKGKK